MNPRKLYLDTTARSFVASPDYTSPLAPPLFYEGDVENIEMYFLTPTGSFSSPYDFANYSVSGITATLRLGSLTTAATVTAWTAITTAVTITASVVITGGSGTTAIQRVQMTPKPVSGYYSLQLPARDVTVSSVTANVFNAAYHGILDGQSVTLTAFSSPVGFVNGGVYFVRDRSRDSFRIATTADGTALTASVSTGGGTAQLAAYTTAPLNPTASPTEIANSLGVAGGSSTQQIVATGYPDDYRLSFAGLYAGTNMPTVVITGNSLAGAPGLLGNLNLNVAAITALVVAGTTDVTLEVDVFNGTLRHTYQTDARLGNDLA
jgi:hypothetical protein